MSKKGNNRGKLPKVVRGTNGTYIFGETLGKGSFGLVKHAVERETGRQYAIKCIDMVLVKECQMEEYVETEKDIMQYLCHPCIIRLYEVIDCPDYKLRLYVMEHAPYGELFDQIAAVDGFTEQQAKRFFWQLVAGLHYMHDAGVVHRDLKAENLLLAKDTSLKICDFGLSRWTGEDVCSGERRRGNQLLFTSLAGTVDYAAPEVHGRTPYLGKPADMWSAGVILFFMLAGKLPFQDCTKELTLERVLSNPPDFRAPLRTTSREIKDLISNLICPNPKKRWTATQVLQHSWFKVGISSSLRDLIQQPRPRKGGSTLSQITVSELDEDSSPPEQIDTGLLRKLELAFKAIDTSRQGTITEDELRDVLITLNNPPNSRRGSTWLPSQEEVRELLFFFNDGRARQVSWDQFVKGYVKKELEFRHALGPRLKLEDLVQLLSTKRSHEMDTEYLQHLREAFKQIDEDGSGVIKRHELRNLLQRAEDMGAEKTSEEELEELFTEMDAGGQDFITFEEFIDAWTTCRGVYSKLRQCGELMWLAEIEEVRKAVWDAQQLAVHVAGEVTEVEKVIIQVIESVNGFASRRQNSQHDSRFARYRTCYFSVTKDTEPQSPFEFKISISPSLTGFSKLTVRRIEGSTGAFHSFYKAFTAALETTPIRQKANSALAEVGEEVHV